ncbi:hypothetical protein GGR95_003851, partial [Sulfitobacter undariae]|nr:hypothetical protein [Sulfitobacter undariae]
RISLDNVININAAQLILRGVYSFKQQNNINK